MSEGVDDRPPPQRRRNHRESRRRAGQMRGADVSALEAAEPPPRVRRAGSGKDQQN